MTQIYKGEVTALCQESKINESCQNTLVGSFCVVQICIYLYFYYSSFIISRLLRVNLPAMLMICYGSLF